MFVKIITKTRPVTKMRKENHRKMFIFLQNKKMISDVHHY